jgi:YcxB-like protein
MPIKTQLTEKDLIHYFFYGTYRKWYIVLLTVISFIAVMVWIVDPQIFGPTDWTNFLFPIIFLVVLPVSAWLGAKRQFKSNKRLVEKMTFSIEPNQLSVIGESFQSQMTWDKFYAVTKTKRLLMLWQTKRLANIIPLRDINDQELNSLRAILIEHKVKNNL